MLPSRCARSAQPSPSAPWPAANSWPYSFIADPQPAEFTTITSTPAASKVAIVRRANRTASLARPVCSDSAPQQPCPAGMTTSQPSAASTRAVASFTPGKNTDCTHPVSMPTTARRGPCAAIRPGRACTTARSLAVSASRGVAGATRSEATSSGASRLASWLRSISRVAPVRWVSRSGPVSSRSRRGYGNVAKIALRASRARSERGGTGAGPGPGGGCSDQVRAASISRS